MISLRAIIVIIGLFHSANAIGFSRNFTLNRMNVLVELPEISDNHITINSFDCKSLEECTINQEKFSTDDQMINTTIKKTCNIEVSVPITRRIRFSSITKLNDDKLILNQFRDHPDAVFMWFLEYAVGDKYKWIQHAVQIIDMKNCTVYNETARMIIPESKTGIVLVRPDKSGLFDVFSTDIKMCKDYQGGRKAVITYDSEGKSIDGPHCLPQLIPNANQFDEGSKIMTFSNEEYFILDKNDYEWGGYLVNSSNHKFRELFHGKCDKPGCVPDFRISTKHGRLTYCLIPKEYLDSVNCFFIDPKTTETTNLTLNYPYKFLEFEVLNLANGDFVTLTNRYERLHSGQVREKRKTENYIDKMINRLLKDNTGAVHTDFDLRRYSNDGNMIGKSISIPGWSCHHPQIRGKVEIIENGKNQICVQSGCVNKKNEVDNSSGQNKFHVTSSSQCSNL